MLKTSVIGIDPSNHTTLQNEYFFFCLQSPIKITCNLRLRTCDTLETPICQFRDQPKLHYLAQLSKKDNNNKNNPPDGIEYDEQTDDDDQNQRPFQTDDHPQERDEVTDVFAS